MAKTFLDIRNADQATLNRLKQEAQEEKNRLDERISRAREQGKTNRELSRQVLPSGDRLLHRANNFLPRRLTAIRDRQKTLNRARTQGISIAQSERIEELAKQRGVKETGTPAQRFQRALAQAKQPKTSKGGPGQEVKAEVGGETFRGRTQTTEQGSFVLATREVSRQEQLDRELSLATGGGTSQNMSLFPQSVAPQQDLEIMSRATDEQLSVLLNPPAGRRDRTAGRFTSERAFLASLGAPSLTVALEQVTGSGPDLQTTIKRENARLFKGGSFTVTQELRTTSPSQSLLLSSSGLEVGGMSLAPTRDQLTVTTTTVTPSKSLFSQADKRIGEFLVTHAEEGLRFVSTPLGASNRLATSVLEETLGRPNRTVAIVSTGLIGAGLAGSTGMIAASTGKLATATSTTLGGISIAGALTSPTITGNELRRSEGFQTAFRAADQAREGVDDIKLPFGLNLPFIGTGVDVPFFMGKAQRAAFDTTLQQEANLRGITDNQAIKQAGKEEVFSVFAKKTAALVGAEFGGEFIGRTRQGLIALRSGGVKLATTDSVLGQTRNFAKVFGTSGRAVLPAGIAEGALGVAGISIAKGEPISPKNVIAGGIAGGATAGVLGGLIGGAVGVGSSGGRKGLLATANILDPLEFPIDIITDLAQKGRNVPVLAIVPSTATTRGSIRSSIDVGVSRPRRRPTRVTRPRAPGAAVPAPARTPVSVRNAVTSVTRAPTSVVTPTRSFIRSQAFTPAISVTPTPSVVTTPSRVGVPTRATTNVPTPTTVPAAVPDGTGFLLPLFFGGVQGKRRGGRGFKFKSFLPTQATPSVAVSLGGIVPTASRKAPFLSGFEFRG